MLNKRTLYAAVLAVALATPSGATTTFSSVDEQDSALALQPGIASNAALLANAGSDNTCMVINTVVCTQTHVDTSSSEAVTGNLLIVVAANATDRTNLSLATTTSEGASGRLAEEMSASTQIIQPPVDGSLWGRLKSMVTLSEDSSLVMGLDSLVWEVSDHALPGIIGLTTIALACFMIQRRRKTPAASPSTSSTASPQLTRAI